MSDTRSSGGAGNQQSAPNFNYISPANATAEEIRALAEERFRYKPWTPEQVENGKAVTDAGVEFAVAIMTNVPPSPTRTRALNLIEEARMLANAAITHGGKF